MTLLELLSSLPREALAEGRQVEVVDGQGRVTTITFGKAIPAAESPFDFRVC